VLSNDELWAVGLMTYDEYVETEGREPPSEASLGIRKPISNSPGASTMSLNSWARSSRSSTTP
jgi:hypothetical protein